MAAPCPLPPRIPGTLSPGRGNRWSPLCSRSFPDSSVGKESACNAGDSGSIPGSGRSAGEGIGCPLQYSWASLVAQLVKDPPAMRGDLGSIPGLGSSPGEGKGYPLHCSGLENSLDCIDHGVAESNTFGWLSLCALGDAAALLCPSTGGPEASSPTGCQNFRWWPSRRCSTRRDDLFAVVDSTAPVTVPKHGWGAAPRLCQLRPQEAVLLLPCPPSGQLPPQGELLPSRHVGARQEECPLQFRNRATQALRF